MLGPSKRSVDKAWKTAVGLLHELGMEAHDPALGSSKASTGRIEDGFEFLSFRIKGSNFTPSRSARSNLLRDLRRSIVSAKKEIATARSSPRRAQARFAQSLVLLDRQIRGWGDAFAITNQRIFAQLDDEISKIIDGYWSWFHRSIQSISQSEKRRMIGLALLSDTPIPM